jgi:hypothetical protein
MPTTFKPSAYPNSTAITITLASLATTSADPPVGRESAEVLQSTDLAEDVLLDGKITTGTSPTASRRIRIWAYAAASDGSTVRRAGGATGSDAGLTPVNNYRTAFALVHWIDTTATSNQEYRFAGISLRQAFGGLFLPARWGLFVDHNTAVNLNSTASNHEIRYTLLTSQGV